MLGAMLARMTQRTEIRRSQRQDIGIWENKIYCEKPMLTRGDGPIHQLRRWYSQFYSAAAAQAAA